MIRRPVDSEDHMLALNLLGTKAIVVYVVVVVLIVALVIWMLLRSRRRV
jgi:hypothetical protein